MIATTVAVGVVAAIMFIGLRLQKPRRPPQTIVVTFTIDAASLTAALQRLSEAMNGVGASANQAAVAMRTLSPFLMNIDPS